MKKMISAAIAAAALAYAPTASAADFLPGSPQFSVSGNPLTGLETVSGSIRRDGLSGTITDRFFFRIGPTTGAGIGLGTGSLITTFTINSATSLTFNSVTFFNGINTYVVPITTFLGGAFAQLNGIPIYSGNNNVLSVNYTAAGNAAYGGQLTFTPGGIPEPMTWAMMIIGFAAVGFAMRRRNKEVARVRYAF